MLRHEFDDLSDGEHIGKTALLRRHAEPATHRDAARRRPEEAYAPEIATAQAQRNLECRSLSRAVGTEQCDDLITPYRERKPVERTNLAI